MEETTQTDGTSQEIRDPQAVLAALERAKTDAKKFREDKEALEKQISDLEGLNEKFSAQLLNKVLAAKLQAENVANPDRIIRYLNLGNLSFDDDFNILGLDEEIAKLKADFPELFDPKYLVAGKADSAEAKAVDKRISASERQAMLVLGRK